MLERRGEYLQTVGAQCHSHNESQYVKKQDRSFLEKTHEMRHMKTMNRMHDLSLYYYLTQILSGRSSFWYS